MDLVRLESSSRDFELFLSRGASLIPEPVYERGTRQMVDNLGVRSDFGETHPIDAPINEQVLKTVTIDFKNRTVVVTKS